MSVDPAVATAASPVITDTDDRAGRSVGDMLQSCSMNIERRTWTRSLFPHEPRRREGRPAVRGNVEHGQFQRFDRGAGGETEIEEHLVAETKNRRSLQHG